LSKSIYVVILYYLSASLFGVNSQAIIYILKNVYAEQELEKDLTCSKMEQVKIEGKRTVIRQEELYTLDAIIAVGYRVKI
jgi:Virulence protein